MHRRLFVQAGSAAFPLTAGLTPLGAAAQEAYPSRPVSIVVAYVPGGSTDQRARQLGRFMSTTWGQPVVVENRPGAAGNIGTEAVAHAKPDGYMLGMGNLAPLAVNPALFRKTGFDPVKELTMIVLIERGPLMLLVNPASGYRSVADVVAGAKAKPGGLSFGSSGAGSAHHLSGELLKSITGADMTHIPYKGGAAASVDLMGGQLDFSFELMYSAMPSVKAGKLRALAITSEKRSPLAPDIPTMIEAGVPGFHMENWQGLVGPAGMPAATVRRINSTVNQALADPAIRAQMLGQGNEIGGGTPEQFAALVQSESERWRKVIVANKIVAE
jgi:tripartite-type tricarboxylate transporter receptor subunit TctC